MDYIQAAENRKSVRGFRNKKLTPDLLRQIRDYADRKALRLNDTETELLFLGSGSGAALEGAAGYQNKMVGAPNYLVILTAPGDYAIENAAFLAEDVVLYLTDLELSTCWITFAESAAVKTALGITSRRDVAAIIAFGYGEKQRKALRLNIRTMSNIDITAQRHYFDPKKSIHELVFSETWGETKDVDGQIGFYGDVLWEAFHAASLAPSYLNRQPFGFLLSGHSIYLVKVPDDYTDPVSHRQDLGIAMLHFAAAVKEYEPSFEWETAPANAPAVPEGYEIIARAAV